MSPWKRVGNGVAPEGPDPFSRQGPYEPMWVHPEWKRPGTARLRRPMELEGLAWPAGTVVHLGYDGSVEAIELPDAREVKGHRCDAGMVVWLRDGQLRGYEGTLREDRRIDGLLLKAGTKVEVRAHGMLVEATLGAEQEVLGQRLPAGTRVSFRHEPGGAPALDLLHLPRPWEIRGVPCDRGRVSFFENGALYEAWLARRCEFDGIPCEAEDLGFHRNGRLARASVGRGTVLAGLPCAGPVRFDEEGRVEALTLARDFEVNGVWLGEGTTVRFHPSGRVRQGMLARETTFGGFGEVLAEKRATVTFREDGGVHQVALKPFHPDIHGLPVAGGEGGWVELTPGGRIGSLVLGRDWTLGEVPVPRGCRVWLDASGRVRTAHHTGWLATFDEQGRPAFALPVTPDRPVDTFESGSLREAHLDRRRTLQGLPCQGGYPVRFHPDLRLAACTLAEEHALEGRTYAAGSRLELDEAGHVLAR